MSLILTIILSQEPLDELKKQVDKASPEDVKVSYIIIFVVREFFLAKLRFNPGRKGTCAHAVFIPNFNHYYSTTVFMLINCKI